ncbi:DMT family transporter [Burkholderia multivorans]|uniref:DMT family transporter n=1 Tax=Burkholderia multivorans TaxID=87883 RepID=UPI000D35A512|nr:DMT family transporter [Burkholderia multivorans]MBR8020483.1 DMT family transporter [Burkholderia multivorans]MEB2511788.1 DMT family transporter [Burkholderia multivorans]MEB2521386.1 DMT family transporter [Burkholderia multivorans]MEB2576947.1 DMT family transporter [Burkholderia multivorans]MEB2595154.1 DMT family transporter [Burkholderia multivorans]
MNATNFTFLLTLAALWGASFLFIRVGAPEFGPVPLMAVRILIAAVFLAIVLGSKREFHRMSGKIVPLFAIGVLNQALPFCLFAYAELTLPAGVTSVINATTPLWAAIVAFVWIGDRLSRTRVAGLFIGFAGVLILVWKDLSGLRSFSESAIAPIAVLCATLLYGISANATKRFLTGVDSLAIATGSMIGAAIVLAPFAVVYWPSTPISTTAWISVIALGVACTGIAYIIYFHLIATAGPARAVSVTFLVPIFGLLWGTLFLDESISPMMIAGCGVVILGTMLASGVLKPSVLVGKRPV